MKLIPFSRDLCRDLIRDGYSHFAVRYGQPRDEYNNRNGKVTYKALRDKSMEPSISIAELMNEPDAASDECYIMLAE